MLIDVEIALGVDRQIHRGMPGQQREHVIEESDARGNAALPGAIEIQFDADLGFRRLAVNGRAVRGTCYVGQATSARVANYVAWASESLPVQAGRFRFALADVACQCHPNNSLPVKLSNHAL